MNMKFMKFKVLSFIFILTTCIITMWLNNIEDTIRTEIANLQISIEDSWKDAARSNLTYLKYELEAAINSNEIDEADDNQITQWVINHSLFKDSKYLKGLSVINIGYSSLDDVMNLKMKLSDSNDIDKDLKNSILYNSDELLNIKGKTDDEKKDLIYKFATKLCLNNPTYDSETIRAILMNIVFEKDKVLFSTNDDIKYDKNKTSYEIGTGDNRIWVESVLIPSGTTGFNSEPIFKNNKDNISYKKIIIAVAMDRNIIMLPYETHLVQLNYLLFIANSLIVIIMLISIVFLFISFRRILNKYNNMGGDTNAEGFRSVCACINSVLRVDGDRIK